MKKMTKEIINTTLKLLNDRMELNGALPIRIVVCGGSALIAANLVSRVTKDVDIVALMNNKFQLIEPAPLPDDFLKAAKQVGELLELPDDWINNEPSSGEGGIFQLGLPESFGERLQEVKYGNALTVYFISRIDQIHFKLWAAVDRSGGYHADDLLALSPTVDELVQAAEWSMSLDPSEGYLEMLKQLLNHIGFEDAAKRF